MHTHERVGEAGVLPKPAQLHIIIQYYYMLADTTSITYTMKTIHSAETKNQIYLQIIHYYNKYLRAVFRNNKITISIIALHKP